MISKPLLPLLFLSLLMLVSGGRSSEGEPRAWGDAFQAQLISNDFRISLTGPIAAPIQDALAAAVPFNDDDDEYLVVPGGVDR